nr:hypothetical protein [Pandoravirus massiliensis]
MIRISAVVVGRVCACSRADRGRARRRDCSGRSRALCQALARVVAETVCARLVATGALTYDHSDERGRPNDEEVLDNDVPEGDRRAAVGGASATATGGRVRRDPRQVETLVAASLDAIDAYLTTPEARALCPVTSCLCGRNFETFARDIVHDTLREHE